MTRLWNKDWSVLLLLCLIASGCSSEGKTIEKQDPPGAGTYTIGFASVPVAVSTETIQVQVYPTLPSTNTCLVYLEKLTSGQDIEGLVAETPLFSPCDLENGSGNIPLDSGEYAFVVVGRRQNKNYIKGCQVGTVSKDSANIEIYTTLFDNTVAVPPTTCGRLSEKCAGTCS